jgi:hypothetical protein
MFTSREIARAHCNADADVPDSLIDLYIESAETSCAQYLAQPLEDLVEGEGEEAKLPADVRHAILLYVANAVANRETIIVGTIFAELPTATRLLQPYRLGMGV